MRQYISELLDFIADMHTLTKLKVSLVLHVSATTRVLSYHMWSFLPLRIVLIVQPYLFLTSEPYEGLLPAAA